jgi:hypothetical protein
MSVSETDSSDEIQGVGFPAHQNFLDGLLRSGVRVPHVSVAGIHADVSVGVPRPAEQDYVAGLELGDTGDPSPVVLYGRPADGDMSSLVYGIDCKAAAVKTLGACGSAVGCLVAAVALAVRWAGGVASSPAVGLTFHRCGSVHDCRPRSAAACADLDDSGDRRGS